MILGDPIIFGGSGGALSASDAILAVTVPTGSTVTATKGGVTITPTIWVTAADPTLDCAIFAISASLFDAVNPWTVTATLGTNTASDTVVIDSNKEYDVELSYDLVLFENGVWAPVTGGVADSANYTVVDGAIRTEGTYASVGKWRTANKIDTTGYAVLHIRCKITARDGSRTLWFGTSTTTNTPSSDSSWGSSLFNAYLQYAPSAVDVDFVDRVVDISGVSENSYVKFGAYLTVFASKIWLSK